LNKSRFHFILLVSAQAGGALVSTGYWKHWPHVEVDQLAS